MHTSRASPFMPSDARRRAAEPAERIHGGYRDPSLRPRQFVGILGNRLDDPEMGRTGAQRRDDRVQGMIAFNASLGYLDPGSSAPQARNDLRAARPAGPTPAGIAILLVAAGRANPELERQNRIDLVDATITPRAITHTQPMHQPRAAHGRQRDTVRRDRERIPPQPGANFRSVRRSRSTLVQSGSSSRCRSLPSSSMRCHITGRPKAARKAVAFYMRASSADRRQ